MKNIKFSVLMSVYYNDSPKQLIEALDSIYDKQSLKPSEIILVKDGPLLQKADESINFIINKYKNIIKVISLEKNRGLSYALNVGASKVSYDYIARMDADDIAFPNRFQLQFELLLTKKLDIVGGQIIEFGKDINDVISERKVPLSDRDIKKVMKTKSPLTHPTIIFKRKVFDELNGYDTTIFPEDYDFFVRASMKGFKFGNVAYNVLWFRVGEDKIAALKRRHGLSYAISEFKLYKKFYKIKYYNYFDFIKVILIKVPLRVLPFPLFKFLYYNLFRKM